MKRTLRIKNIFRACLFHHSKVIIHFDWVFHKLTIQILFENRFPNVLLVRSLFRFS